jgi:hypothetical protein
MRARSARFYLAWTVLLTASACDGYLYNGMDGNQIVDLAADMNLAETYDLYIASYKGVSPPMIDVAFTFKRRFGDRGRAFLAQKALVAEDSRELEAAIYALAVSDASCPDALRGRLLKRVEKLGARRSSLDLFCH